MSEHFNCVDCGRGFTLSYDHQRWFIEKGLDIPKRCERCRGQGRYDQETAISSTQTGTRWPVEIAQEILGPPSPTPQPTGTGQPSEWKSSYLLWLGVIAGIVVLAAICIVVFLLMLV